MYRIPHRVWAKDRRHVSSMSLTWTHQFDIHKPICPRELRSCCVNKSCEYQHLGSMRGGLGHALFVIDYVVSHLNEKKRNRLEKDIVRAKIDIYSGKKFETTLNSLLTRMYPVPTKAPYLLPSPSSIKHHRGEGA